MCRKRYEVLFSRCVTRNEKTSKKVVEEVRTSGNVYYIKDIKESKCFLT